jgi:hypothetical protein
MEGELEGEMEGAGISRDLSSEDYEAKITGRRQSSEDQSSWLVAKNQR